MRKYIIIPIFTLLLITACSPAESQPEDDPELNINLQSDKNLLSHKYTLKESYPSLEFENPLFLTHDNDTNKVYIVEKTGKIKYFNNDSSVKTADIFLDLSDRVDSDGTEQGLLGLAFHPDYKENGYFYVNYTAENKTKIARYRRLNNSNKTDLDSEIIILEFEQPYANHNGGHMAFGSDGYLYIGTGDGGAAGDPENNAQNKASLLGKILRIDVDNVGEDRSYAIPDENPFKGNAEGYREEIYAYGLRNPWRFSFDPESNMLIAADVGQDRIEEINIIESGGNYGWRIMEGTEEFEAIEPMPVDLKDPIWEYNHSLGRSITGGYVYDGENRPSLKGLYIYGDFITGKIWALQIKPNRKVVNYELLDSDLMISSFGLDSTGELYIVDLNGKIYNLIEEN